MAVRIPTGVQNARLDATVAAIDAGTGPGVINIYSGSQPASANDAASGTLLATVTLNDPSFPASASGQATGNGFPKTTTGLAAAGAGTAAGWARITDSDANTVIDVSVGTSGAQVILNTTTISENVDVELTSATLTEASGE